MLEQLFEIKELEKDGKNYAKLEISPLAAGYGDTLGVALRRVMLNSLSGAAITSVKISGVKHQFSTLKGMKEDVLDFLLNLKRVRFSMDSDDSATVTISANKEGEVTAGQIQTPGGVEVANPDFVLAHLSKGAKLEATMTVEKGIGYLSSEEMENEGVGFIPLDANFSPIERINYKVSDTRVGRVTNYDKLVMEVWTDGTVAPKDGVVEAAKILRAYLGQIVNPEEVEEEETVVEDEGLGMVGKLSVEEIGLPTRVANALSKAGYENVEKLSKATDSDLKKVRNLGEKSVKFIDKALNEKGVERNA